MNKKLILLTSAAMLTMNISESRADDCICNWSGANNKTLTISKCSQLTRSSCTGKKSTANNVIIGTGVTSIGEEAFGNASSLRSITIPDSVTNIGDYAFVNATGLTSITIPDSVTSIGDFAFSSTSLTSITLSDSVTSIGTAAFASTDLTSITIPEGVTSIGDSAFFNASSLTSITIPDSLVFADCDALCTHSDVVLIISDKLDMTGWDDDVLNDDGDGKVTFKCKGNQDVCKEKIAEFASRASYISGNNIIFDAGDHRECFRTKDDEENISYYHTGTECAGKYQLLPYRNRMCRITGKREYNLCQRLC